MNKINLSTADKVLEHLETLEIETLEKRKQQSQNNKNQTHSIKQVNIKTANDEFSESELAILINPQRLQALMEQADGFINGMGGMIETFENTDAI